MKIAVICNDDKKYFNVRLIESAKELSGNIGVEIINPEKCGLMLDCDGAKVFVNDKSSAHYDFVISRLINNTYASKVLKHFKNSNTRVVNDSSTFYKCKDRFTILKNLSMIENVSIPKTLLVKSYRDIRRGVEILGGFPVVLKTSLQDKEMLGSILLNKMSDADTFADLNFIYEHILHSDRSVIVQEFVQGAKGKNKNFIIVGKKVVAAFEDRESPIGNINFDTLKNFVPGSFEVDEQTKTMLVSIAEHFKLDFGLVSLVENDGKKIFFEVNPVVDIEPIEKYYKIDVLSELLKYMINLRGV